MQTATSRDPGGSLDAETLALIGTETSGEPEFVGSSDVSDFGHAVRWPADGLRRYIDEAYARDSRHGGLVAPHTFLGRLARRRGYSLPIPVPRWLSDRPGAMAAVTIEQRLPSAPATRSTPARRSSTSTRTCSTTGWARTAGYRESTSGLLDFVGSTLTSRGRLISRSTDGARPHATCRVWVQDQSGAIGTTGTATIIQEARNRTTAAQ